MRLFAFGLGYAARRVLARLPGVEASGATRDPETARAWRRDGVAAWAVDDPAARPALEAALRGAETLLVSAPPDENGDPALQRFGAAIAAAPALARVVYLSSVGVYGDRGGAWVDESSAPAPGSPRARRRLAAEARMARIRRSARRVRRRPAACRHLRPRPQRAREAPAGRSAADRQAGPGLQPHPCRRHRRPSRFG